MVLGYKKEFPWGGETRFPEKIKAGIKIHTVRRGNRFRKGMKIHHATGVRTKHYKCFKKGVCNGTEKIRMWFDGLNLKIMIGARELGLVEKIEFAKNDGFDEYDDLAKWFWIATNEGQEIFKGQVIHYTEKRYSDN